MASEVAANARPSRPRPRSQTGGDGGQDGDHLDQQGGDPLARHDLGPDGEAEHVAAAATGATRRPTCTARSRSSPTVLSARKLALQQAQQHHRDPGEQRVRVEQVGERPRVLLVGPDRHPVEQVAEGHADEQGGRAGPCRWWRRPRPGASGRCPVCRGTRTTPCGRSAPPAAAGRPGRSRRTWSRTGRGKAAKVPAAATISHTSLPSQIGAMVRMAAPRASSSRPTTPWSMPTPKSNPSSTRNPGPEDDQDDEPEGDKGHALTSVGEVEGGRLVLGLGGGGRQLLAGAASGSRRRPGWRRARRTR